MKAIIIQDHDARALLDQLKLETMDANRRDYATLEMEVRDTIEKILGPLSKQKSMEAAQAVALMLSSPTGEMVREIHGRFHFVVTKWLQEQGASVTR